jgi:type II secretory pathway predicted ATPase ExeA
MYEKHFGLRRRPFRPTPDSDAYYPATTHEQAVERLVHAIDGDEGLILLTGEPGTGKTLLCHRLLERLGERAASAFLTTGHMSDRMGLLQAILFDLSIPFEKRTEQELRLALTGFLLENFKSGRRGLIIVDEAHHLSTNLLEELRLLANLEARQGKAVQVILVALPAIFATLHHPDLTPLRQRLAVRSVLEPLGPDEAADYIVHQLRSAGGRPEEIIADEALNILVQGAQGIPRLLNQSAHHALLLAQAAGQTQVDAEAALEALNVLGLAMEAVMAEPPRVCDELGEPVVARYTATEDGEQDDEVSRHLLVPPKRPA